MNPANHRRHAYEAEGVRREWFSMPCAGRWLGRFIWGATAGMLRNFYRFWLPEGLGAEAAGAPSSA
jgi:hypothetical protein